MVCCDFLSNEIIVRKQNLKTLLHMTLTLENTSIRVCILPIQALQRCDINPVPQTNSEASGLLLMKKNTDGNNCYRRCDCLHRYPITKYNYTFFTTEGAGVKNQVKGTA